MHKKQSQQIAGREISFCHSSSLTPGNFEIVVMVKEKILEEKMNLLDGMRLLNLEDRGGG